MKTRFYCLFFSLLSIGMYVYGQKTVLDDQKPILRRRTLNIMGTSLDIKVIGSDGQRLEKTLDNAISELQRIEDLMTDWRPSPLTRLNQKAGHGPQKVPTELARLIARSIELTKLTDGSFDITYAAIGKLWKFGKEDPLPPNEQAIADALPYVNARLIKVDLANNFVTLPAKMKIGLGGIAKGYGVDQAMSVLMRHGIRHAVVNAGGDMKILGNKFGKPWKVVIKHPRKRGETIAALKLSNNCVVTSGDYERFFMWQGKRYHHIIDVRTGYPAHGCMSATIIAPNAAFADALATAMCVLGPQRGLKIVEQLPRIEAILVDMEGKVHVSSGLPKK